MNVSGAWTWQHNAIHWGPLSFCLKRHSRSEQAARNGIIQLPAVPRLINMKMLTSRHRPTNGSRVRQVPSETLTRPNVNYLQTNQLKHFDWHPKWTTNNVKAKPLMPSLAMRWPFRSINGAHVHHQKPIEPEPSSGLFSLQSKRLFADIRPKSGLEEANRIRQLLRWLTRGRHLHGAPLFWLMERQRKLLASWSKLFCLHSERIVQM